MSQRLRSWVPPAVVFVAGLAVWEAIVRIFEIKQFILPAPSRIAVTFQTEAPALTTAALGTFSSVLIGLVVGTVFAILMALTSARWRIVREGLMPIAVAANSTPIIVLAPVFNSWFGIVGSTSKILIAAVLVFFPILVNLLRGLLSADAAQLELMQSYAASRRTTLWKLQFPAAQPYLFSALKVAGALSLIAVIVAEFFGGSQDRIGQYITSKAGLLQFEEAWAAIVLASAFGILLYVAVSLIERRIMPWHVSVRGRST